MGRMNNKKAKKSFSPVPVTATPGEKLFSNLYISNLKFAKKQGLGCVKTLQYGQYFPSGLRIICKRKLQY